MYDYKAKYTPFSYLIEITMKKVIDSIDYTLHFKLKIKRWEISNLLEEGGVSYLTGKESTSLYTYKENEYYYENNIIFNKIRIKKNNSTFMFDNTADKIYSNIMNLDIEKGLRNIKKSNVDSKDIFLVGLKNTKKIKELKYTLNGAGLPERNEMLRLVGEKLPSLRLRVAIPSLKGEPKSKTEDIHKDKLKLYGIDKYITSESGNKRLPKDEYLINSKENMITFFIATDKEKLVEMIISATRMLLRLDEEVGMNIFKNLNGVNVEFKIINDNFTRALDDGETFDSRKKEVEDFIDSKLNFNNINLAVIDIPKYHEIKSYEDKDPKQVIRVALKNKRVLTQFINYTEEKSIIDVILNSVRDLLSAVSFYEKSLYKDMGVNNSDILLGINKVSTLNNESRIAISKIIDGVIYVKLYPEKKWSEVREYIYSINKSTIKNTNVKLNYENKPKIEQWIEACIAEELNCGNIIYCFIDCVLRNCGWNFIRNDLFIDFNSLRIAGKNRLRLIRFNSTDEIPDYFIYDKKDNVNKRKGMFKSSNNTYYLIGGRIDTDNISGYMTKLMAPKKQLKRPSLYEINIQGAKNEQECDSIAIMTQKLRIMNITYNKESSSPLPLYCINRLSEYLIAENSIK